MCCSGHTEMEETGEHAMASVERWRHSEVVLTSPLALATMFQQLPRQQLLTSASVSAHKIF